MFLIIYLQVTTQPQSQAAFVEPITLEQNWTIPAILSCVFCFWPTGIGAIIAANNVSTKILHHVDITEINVFRGEDIFELIVDTVFALMFC